MTKQNTLTLKHLTDTNKTSNLFPILTSRILSNSSIGLTDEKLYNTTCQTKSVYYLGSEYFNLFIAQVENICTF